MSRPNDAEIHVLWLNWMGKINFVSRVRKTKVEKFVEKKDNKHLPRIVSRTIP